MRVLTVDNDKLQLLCRRLQAKVAGSAFAPDAVVAIASGGVHVAGAMFTDVPHMSVVCRRSTTSAKHNVWLRRVMHRTPYALLNAVRIAEALWLGRRRTVRSLPPLPLDAEVVQALRGARRILVVDDAVDTGTTLRRVLDAVHRAAPGARVRSAVLTVTMENPCVRPDYTLYDNATLLRFEWSADFKHTAR